MPDPDFTDNYVKVKLKRNSHTTDVWIRKTDVTFVGPSPYEDFGCEIHGCYGNRAFTCYHSASPDDLIIDFIEG